MAAQCQLGILSQRWTGPPADGPGRPGRTRTNLTGLPPLPCWDGCGNRFGPVSSDPGAALGVRLGHANGGGRPQAEVGPPASINAPAATASGTATLDLRPPNDLGCRPSCRSTPTPSVVPETARAVPPPLAAHRPRSVISPVTSRAGVTSKAGLAAGCPAAPTRTVAIVPVGQPPGHVGDLGGGAFLDRDLRHPVGQRPVDGGGRHRDPERHVVVARRQRLQIGADLVGHVAGAGHPVGADDRPDRPSPCCIRCPPALSATTVCGTPCLPSSQAVSAAPWLRGRVSSTQTCRSMPALMRDVDRRQRGAPIDRREPAGVAMGQHVHPAALAARPPRSAATHAGRSPRSARRPRRRSAAASA